MRTKSINDALLRTISAERLQKYLDHTNNDLHAALGLYEKNIRLAEAFYTPLQCVEICLRNVINEVMKVTYGDNWLNEDQSPLDVDSLRLIIEARSELREKAQPLAPGKIIAQLRFGFWVGLLGRRYDNTLWRKCLHAAFRARGSKTRAEVHGRFNAIRRLRNRIAHHEPILWDRTPLDQMHREIIEAIAWMCPATAEWAAHHSRVTSVLST